MQFLPLYDRLLVQRCAEETYQGSIVIPDSAKEKPLEGMVLAVGAGRYNDAGNLMPMSVKAGDRILMGKYAGSEIRVDGTELLILREDEVLGILTGVPIASVTETLKSVPLHVSEADPGKQLEHQHEWRWPIFPDKLYPASSQPTDSEPFCRICVEAGETITTSAESPEALAQAQAVVEPAPESASDFLDALKKVAEP